MLAFLRILFLNTSFLTRQLFRFISLFLMSSNATCVEGSQICNSRPQLLAQSRLPSPYSMETSAGGCTGTSNLTWKDNELSIFTSSTPLSLLLLLPIIFSEGATIHVKQPVSWFLPLLHLPPQTGHLKSQSHPLSIPIGVTLCRPLSCFSKIQIVF